MRTFEEKDFPGLYQSADRASLDSQATYLRLFRWNLILLVVASAFALLGIHSRESALISAGLFLTTMFLSILLAYRQYDRTWYNGRAVAESVKTRAWRFMMRAEPYQNGSNLAVVKSLFLNDLNQILQQNQHLAEHLGQNALMGEGISSAMLAVRDEPLPARIEWYRDARIHDQWTWYGRKAGANKRSATRLFIALCALQALAVAFVLLNVAYPSVELFPTDVCAVAAAAMLSWMQAKRYQDLSSSYSLAAHEIGIIKCQLDDIADEAAFSRFVVDAESAFSREHTQWQARRSA